MTNNKAIAISRWRDLCDSLGVQTPDAEYQRLIRAWQGWNRKYHTLEHLAACLRELDEVGNLATHSAEVEMALWFHDAVYKTRRQDNEAKSAEWARTFLQSRGASEDTVNRVSEMILATAHNASSLSGDAALTVDIDLSILGQPSSVYNEFERNVRREYWWVPRKRFNLARAGILRSFLNRCQIYHWSIMRDKFEVKARENLERAIAKLIA